MIKIENKEAENFVTQNFAFFTTHGHHSTGKKNQNSRVKDKQVLSLSIDKVLNIDVV